MSKTKLVVVALAAVMALLVGSVAIPALAWFDRTYEGYLPGSPSNGRLGYTHGTNVRAWTLDMRWSTTTYVRRDNTPRIDITADCDSGTGADHLHVTNWVSNLPGKSFQSWSDCGNVLIKEEGEIYFDKYGISTATTNYEADVIYQKKLTSANGAVDHSYQRASGPDAKVCGSATCGDANHDWLAKTVYVNYNYKEFQPANAGWTASLGSIAYAAEPLRSKEGDVFGVPLTGVPFAVQVAKDGGHTRGYVEIDFRDLVGLQRYVQWNAARARALSANLEHAVPVKVTFRSPVSIAEAQSLVDATGLALEQTTFVGRGVDGQPYSGGTLSDGAGSMISVGDLQPVLDEKEITLDGVMVIEGVVGRGDALQTLLEGGHVHLVDVVADFALQQARGAGATDLQGMVVPSPYWSLYLDWISRAPA